MQKLTDYQINDYERIKKKLILLNRKNQPSLLDIGCGEGQLLLQYAETGWSTIGVELSRQRLNQAKQNSEFSGINITLVEGDGQNLCFNSNTFDLITLQLVLHHIPEPQKLFREVKRVLKPNGFIFVLETPKDTLFIRLGRFLHNAWKGDEVTLSFYADSFFNFFEKMRFEVLIKGTLGISPIQTLNSLVPKRFQTERLRKCGYKLSKIYHRNSAKSRIYLLARNR